jgi:AGZA family xanthine/uracil permease-like MFS transporter
VGGGGTPLSLGTLVGVPVAVTLFGLLITIVMFTRQWRGAIILGILFSTILAIILNYDL